MPRTLTTFPLTYTMTSDLNLLVRLNCLKNHGSLMKSLPFNELLHLTISHLRSENPSRVHQILLLQLRLHTILKFLLNVLDLLLNLAPDHLAFLTDPLLSLLVLVATHHLAFSKPGLALIPDEIQGLPVAVALLRTR